MKHVVAAILLVGLSSSLARAGAWTQDEGQGLFIVQTSYATAEQRFDDLRLAEPTPTFEEAEILFYAEYGLWEGMTLLALGGVRQSTLDDPLGAIDQTSLAPSGGGVRVRLFTWDQSVVSLQATIAEGVEFERTGPGALNGEGTDADMRVLWGTSTTIYGFPIFMDAQAAYRLRLGPEPDELRLEIGGGVTLTPSLQLLVSSVSVVTWEEGEDGFPLTEQYQVQASALYQLTDEFGLQLGGFSTLAGRNIVQENGVTAGLWVRFSL